MKRLFMFLAAMLLAAIPANAQSEYPRAEIFGGYSYLSADTGVDIDEEFEGFFDNRESFHGVGFSVAGNLSRRFGIVADFSYNRKKIGPFGPVIVIPGQSAVEGDFDLNVLFFLFGPRVYARSERVTGFAHALVGGARVKTEANFPGLRVSESDTNFAMGFGGGVDVNLTDNIGVRLIQLDYVPVKMGGFWLHNLRAQVGVTLRWGQ